MKIKINKKTLIKLLLKKATVLEVRHKTTLLNNKFNNRTFKKNKMSLSINLVHSKSIIKLRNKINKTNLKLKFHNIKLDLEDQDNFMIKIQELSYHF